MLSCSGLFMGDCDAAAESNTREKFKGILRAFPSKIKQASKQWDVRCSESLFIKPLQRHCGHLKVVCPAWQVQCLLPSEWTKGGVAGGKVNMISSGAQQKNAQLRKIINASDQCLQKRGKEVSPWIDIQWYPPTPAFTKAGAADNKS